MLEEFASKSFALKNLQRQYPDQRKLTLLQSIIYAKTSFNFGEPNTPTAEYTKKGESAGRAAICFLCASVVKSSAHHIIGTLFRMERRINHAHS
jgi:hypothetical protein